ncbi:uncharacterized protein GIQ15_02915 [Arthroderma uncinatum]|uniref:uncharacterized protein n=1 Tax=Arthroderma uncinatum TaxID=74035 RepID=UPI00144A4FB9|nr:uncharacterized protein GIQ15_02915 [Arthroderma uncinatum]KAF3483591.1 hypothetical protein GIQ15_02915 [Arthroderma uncinatum]
MELQCSITIHSSTLEDDEGNEFKEEYVVRQLSECTGSLESLETALETKANNAISLNDPKGLKANDMETGWSGNQSHEKAGSKSVAAAGTFATWRSVLRESENSGLDMQDVVSAHLEFRGVSQFFKKGITFSHRSPSCPEKKLSRETLTSTSQLGVRS